MCAHVLLRTYAQRGRPLKKMMMPLTRATYFPSSRAMIVQVLDALRFSSPLTPRPRARSRGSGVSQGSHDIVCMASGGSVRHKMMPFAVLMMLQHSRFPRLSSSAQRAAAPPSHVARCPPSCLHSAIVESRVKGSV